MVVSTFNSLGEVDLFPWLHSNVAGWWAREPWAMTGKTPLFTQTAASSSLFQSVQALSTLPQVNSICTKHDSKTSIPGVLEQPLAEVR